MYTNNKELRKIHARKKRKFYPCHTTEILEQLNNPQILPNHKLGVFVSKKVHFDKHSIIDSNPFNPLSQAFYILGGTGWGSYDVTMIFDQQKQLEGIKIVKNYKKVEV